MIDVVSTLQERAIDTNIVSLQDGLSGMRVKIIDCIYDIYLFREVSYCW